MTKQTQTTNNSMRDICEMHCPTSNAQSASSMTHAMKEHCGQMNNAIIFNRNELIDHDEQVYKNGYEDGAKDVCEIIYVVGCVCICAVKIYNHRHEIAVFVKDKREKFAETLRIRKHKTLQNKNTETNSNADISNQVIDYDSDYDSSDAADQDEE